MRLCFPPLLVLALVGFASAQVPGEETGKATTKKSSNSAESPTKSARKNAGKKSGSRAEANEEKPTATKSISSKETDRAATKSSAAGAEADAPKSSTAKTPATSASPSSQPVKKSSNVAKEPLTGEAALSRGGSASVSTPESPAVPSTSGKQPTGAKPPQDNAGDEPTVPSGRVIGPNITLETTDLREFDTLPAHVQRLLRLSLDLTRKGLVYRYGSSDPSSGGMDCSGTIYYLLRASGVKEPPRDSSALYLWTEREGTLRKVAPTSLNDPVLADMQPGDLMFWEGTYEVQRIPPISHTMIYLGREKRTGVPVMVGASDGRTYGGVSRNGVSVFDFRLPAAGSTSRFVGYGKVPGLEKMKATE